MRKPELRKWRENYTPYNSYCLGEGLKLHVHFEEKDFIKDIGGRWCPDESGHRTGGRCGYWWMPANMLDQKLGPNIPAIVNTFDSTNAPAKACASITVLEWLNDNKMLTNEIHGDLRSDACESVVENATGKTYSLSAVQDGPGAVMSFIFFEDLGIVKVTTTQPHGNPSTGPTTRESSVWSTADAARILWNALVKSGSKRDERVQA